MKKTPSAAIMSIALSFAVLGGVALAAQNRSTLKVPNGLAFSEFKGYENWQYVAVSQTATSVKIIAANPVMIKAFRQGVPGNHRPFPEGSKIVKIEWLFKKNMESPYFVNVPDTLKTLSFIEKDSKRFPDTHGWAYAVFINDPATDTLTPDGRPPQNGAGATCGYACHTTVAAKDYIFMAQSGREVVRRTCLLSGVTHERLAAHLSAQVAGRVANHLLEVIEETAPCRRACDSCAIVLERRSPVANDRPGDLCGAAGRAYD